MSSYQARNFLTMAVKGIGEMLLESEEQLRKDEMLLEAEKQLRKDEHHMCGSCQNPTIVRNQ